MEPEAAGVDSSGAALLLALANLLGLGVVRSESLLLECERSSNAAAVTQARVRVPGTCAGTAGWQAPRGIMVVAEALRLGLAAGAARADGA
mmetsp:Transcript_49223/g.74880  ORF Transcript_49223/g.74880 Transcript_49223/m.74880 type:complete len:91 (+) Transcript_49223:777-1049(+)